MLALRVVQYTRTRINAAPAWSHLDILHAHVPEPPGRDPDQPQDIPPPGRQDDEIDLPPREDPAPVREPGKPSQPQPNP